MGKRCKAYAQAAAKFTLTPLGYLFLPVKPVESLPIPDFRSRNRDSILEPSPNLLDTIYLMQRRKEWMHENQAHFHVAPLPFVGAYGISDDPVAVANNMRATLRLELQWASSRRRWTESLLDLKDAAESIGIMVFINSIVENSTNRKLDPDEFQGFVFVDNLAPLIFVNGGDWKSAQIFTLAHELAHLWIGREGLIKLDKLQPPNSDVERFCNRVAAEFLVPEESLRAMWLEIKDDPQRFNALARKFKVSSITAALQAKDKALITQQEYTDFYDAEKQRDFAALKKKGSPTFDQSQPNRVGRLFALALDRAVSDGRLRLKDAYQMSGLYGGTFDRYLGKIRAGRNK